jgi:TRAP transporter TAXI family solute receptor
MSRSKVLYLLLVLMLIAALQQPAGAQQPKPLNLTLVGGRTGGVWSVFSEGIAESIRKSNPGAIVTVEPGSTSGNPGLVNQGRIPLGLAYSLTAYAAFRGTEPYAGKPSPNLRAVAAVMPKNLYQFCVSKKSGLTSLTDIKTKKFALRVSVDDKGSLADLITREMFKAYGFSYQNIESWGGKIFYLSGDKTFEMMSDGRMDAMPDALPCPSGDILEASANQDLELLSFSDQAIKEVGEALRLSTGVVPAGTYKFLKRDIRTVSVPVILITNKDVPEDTIYRTAKSIYDNLAYLATVHDAFKDLNKDTIAVVGGLALHPGATKFYKEKGILK